LRHDEGDVPGWVLITLMTAGLFAAILVGVVLPSEFNKDGDSCDSTLRLSCTAAEQPTGYTTGYWLTFLSVVPLIVAWVMTFVSFAQRREAIRP